MAPQKKSLNDLKNKKLLKTKGLINGQWVDSASSKSTFDVVDPATLDKLATLPEMDRGDVDLAVDAAFEAFKTYKKTTARQRARMLRKWSDLCHENVDDLALIMTLENGKTLTESKGEVIYGASFLEWFATQAEMTHGETVPTANPNQRILTIKQPVGVAAALAPWNCESSFVHHVKLSLTSSSFSSYRHDYAKVRRRPCRWLHDCLETRWRDTSVGSGSSSVGRRSRLSKWQHQCHHIAQQRRRSRRSSLQEPKSAQALFHRLDPRRQTTYAAMCADAEEAIP